MKRASATLFLIALTATAALAAPPPASAGQAAGLVHQVALLIGRPAESSPGSEGVLIVPGTVIPLGADVTSVAKDAGRRAGELAELSRKLESTLRLAELEVQYDMAVPLALGREHRLAAPKGSDLDLRVELVGAGPEVATYRVAMTGDGKQLADTKVAVPIGRRAVVGGLDGTVAPYLFLVLEPRRNAGRDLGSGFTPPRLVERIDPKYPEEARKAGTEGQVILDAEIGKDGREGEVRLIQGLPDGLDQAAIDALRQWRFEPARDAGGRPVAVRYTITINFVADKKPKEP